MGGSDGMVAGVVKGEGKAKGKSQSNHKGTGGKGNGKVVSLAKGKGASKGKSKTNYDEPKGKTKGKSNHDDYEAKGNRKGKGKGRGRRPKTMRDWFSDSMPKLEVQIWLRNSTDSIGQLLCSEELYDYLNDEGFNTSTSIKEVNKVLNDGAPATLKFGYFKIPAGTKYEVHVVNHESDRNFCVQLRIDDNYTLLRKRDGFKPLFRNKHVAKFWGFDQVYEKAEYESTSEWNALQACNSKKPIESKLHVRVWANDGHWTYDRGGGIVSDSRNEENRVRPGATVEGPLGKSTMDCAGAYRRWESVKGRLLFDMEIKYEITVDS